MDIPIALFLGFIAMTLAIVVFGIIKRIPVMILAGGLFLIFWSVMTDNIIVDAFFDPTRVTSYSYNYESQSGTSQLNLGGNIAYGMFASTGSSLLVGDTINCIDLYIKKTGVPTGTMTIGTLDSTANIVKSFGTQDVSLLSTANVWKTYCLVGGDTYTILSGDRIGARYAGGNATNGVGFNRDSAGTFDGTVTFQQVYTSSWASNTGTDDSMRFYLTGQEGSVVNNPYPFTEIPKVLFSFFGIMIMVVSLVISKYDD